MSLLRAFNYFIIQSFKDSLGWRNTRRSPSAGASD